ncbi:hypothetical protein, partial [Methylibium sp.]|uniref:hypothetical protein n=1 Tax=Methylibium sp. TaxID=2067992 RepID=UPI0025DC4201
MPEMKRLSVLSPLRIVGPQCHAFVRCDEQSRGRAAGFASVRRSALRADCAALLGLVAPSQNSLRSLR